MKHRHELRDRAGRLVAVLDELILDPAPLAEPGMIEFAIDAGGASYKLRIFPRSARQVLAAA
jgi:hypothetical protein